MPDPFAALIAHIAPGSSLVETRPLKGGISAGMTAITIERPEGGRERLIVRVQSERDFAFDPQATSRMYRTLEALAPQSPVVPKPIFLDEAGAFFGRPCLVMSRIDGEADYALEFGPVFAVGAADRLAEIHGTDPAGLGFLPEFNDWMRWRLDHPPEMMDAALRESEIRAVLETSFPFPNPNGPALLHGDFWPGNLLWRGAALVGVVDWEETAIGDPLADLAIARMDILFAFGRDVMADFTRRFLAASPGVDPADLPYWDLYAALRPAGNLHEWAEGWPAFGRPDVTYKTMRRDQNEFVEDAIS